MIKTLERARLALAVAAALSFHGMEAQAQIVVNDTLTGAVSTYPWSPQFGACLTASSTSYSPPTNYIPGCFASDYNYYSTRSPISKLIGGDNGTLPDAVNKGALRLTNGDTTSNGSNGNQQTGAVVSTQGFPMTGGVQITWTSVTYGGNAYIPSGFTAANGADGISFFLADAAEPVTVGGSGGSLGYSCSNTNATYNGVRGGYIGVGIDEFGNFANSGDNTNSGPGFNPGLISVRGAGSTNWDWLHAHPIYGAFYPTGTNTAAVMQATCKAGSPINNSGSDQTDAGGNKVKAGKTSSDKLPNYKYLVPPVYPTALTIANQEAIAKPMRSADPVVTKTSNKGATPITFNLGITSAGLLDFSYSINGGSSQIVFKQFDIVKANGIPLPQNVRFGFAAGTGGGSNIHEITCFKAAPNSQDSGSAGSSAQPSAKIPGGAQIYLAFYNTNNWYGTLSAFGVDPQTALVATSPNWEAGCQLTGSTMQNCTATPPVFSSRTILSWNEATSKGVAFTGGNLSTSQATAMNLVDNQASLRADFLRGDRSHETSVSKGIFRSRTGLLGDIVDSSPVWLGQPQSPYSSPFTDKLGASATPEGSSYATFAKTYQGRTNVVYVGSNDGMLHGFRAGTFDGTSYVNTGNDGTEVLAYVPNAVVQTIHSPTPSLDFSSPAYSHNFYVDGTPGIGDLYYGGNWHTWLVSGLGAGGQPNGAIADDTTTTSASAIFALDVTDPSTFAVGQAANLVLGEWSPATFPVCANVSNCGKNLGQTYGTPQIRRLHDGNWAVLFGNGLNSVNGSAGLFVMTVDQTSGAKTFRYFDTGAGPVTSGSTKSLNGIVQVSPVDMDGDHITDYVYAGDVLGNVWRFDLTDKSPSNWKAGTALFTTAAGQPITTALAVASVPATGSSGRPKVIVAFGTGQKEPLTVTSAETYAPATQALYGIWDWDMSAWNGTATDTKYDSLASGTGKITASQLVTQTISTFTDASTGIQYRTDTSNPVCWSGTQGCTTSSTAQMGWTLALQGAVSTATPPTLSEQAIFNPIVLSNEFVINTFIPGSSTSATLFCAAPQSGGFTMAVQMANGGAATTSFLPLPNGTFSQTISVVGLGDGAVGTPTPLNSTDGKSYIVSGTAKGGSKEEQTNPTGGTGSRVNWTKVR
jgi:type IV pilus assembly protein PilY1